MYLFHYKDRSIIFPDLKIVIFGREFSLYISHTHTKWTRSRNTDNVNKC